MVTRADAILLYVPELPPRFGILITVLALVGAFKFTGWYPQRRGVAAENSALIFFAEAGAGVFSSSLETHAAHGSAG